MNRILAFLTTLLISAAVMSHSVLADQWFDNYPRLSWSEEKARLFSFGVFLSQHPRMKGYIGFCSEDKKSVNTDLARIRRGQKFLISEMKISRERIQLVNGGICENSRTILQPVDSTAPPPVFFPLH